MPWDYQKGRLKSARRYAEDAVSAARKGNCQDTWELIGGAWFNYGAAISDIARDVKAARDKGKERTRQTYQRAGRAAGDLHRAEERIKTLCRCPVRSLGSPGPSKKFRVGKVRRKARR